MDVKLILFKRIEIPKLKPKTRSREFNSFPELLKDKIIYEYLFSGKTHRQLDKEILGLDPTDSRGYQSMSILHFIGLRANHKGIFKGLVIETAIDLLKNSTVDDYTMIINMLERAVSGTNPSMSKKESIYEYLSGETEFFEGKEEYRLHKIRERDPNLVKTAKQAFIKKHGSLYCEVCGVNFEKSYGERGRGFIEVHHTKPIAEMKEGEVTKVEDVAMLCSNCHRMIHREPFITVEQLKKIIRLI